MFDLRVDHVVRTQLLHDGREIDTTLQVVMPEQLDHLLEHWIVRVLVHMRWDDRAFIISEHEHDFRFRESSEGVATGENVAHQHTERVYIPFFKICA